LQKCEKVDALPTLPQAIQKWLWVIQVLVFVRVQRGDSDEPSMNPNVSTTNVQQIASFKRGRPMREIIEEGCDPGPLRPPAEKPAWELTMNKAKIDG